MVTSAAQELADLLLRAGEIPIEHGATALFESIAGGIPVNADISQAPVGQLTDEERILLGTPEPADVLHREGLLRCATGRSVASITALVVTSRIPEPARQALGITPAGHTPRRAQARAPLGRALHGLGITREQLAAAATPGHLDEAGSEIAVISFARLWIPSGWPLALVTERVRAQFLAAYLPPWPLPA
jgi:hypothetical protein